MPYPFWIKAFPTTENFSALSGISTVTLAWPNSFELTSTEGVSMYRLLETSLNSGSQTGTYTIAPNQIKAESFSSEPKQMLVGVAAKKDNLKIVVVGDSDFATDQFTKNNSDNLNFATNLIDWVALDEAIASIPKKSGDNPVFRFSSAAQIPIVQYGNILFAPIVVGLIGFWWLRRRKRLAERIYRV